MKDGVFALLVGVVVVFVLIGMVLFAKQQSECSAKGGVLVKAAFGYACVAQP